MNNKIYTFINNKDYPEACYSSYDESLLREIMCDEFMLDVMCEFNSRMNGAESYNKERIAKESWNDVLDYYNFYVDIVVSDII